MKKESSEELILLPLYTHRGFMTIKAKLFGTSLPPVWKGDWIDLQAAATVKYKAGDMVVIPLGIAMELPRGYEAHILPRSSTFKYYGLLHAASGLIDSDYNGDEDEWHFYAYATRDGNVPMGARICQFRIMQKMPPISFKFVSSLGNKNRGGFGSTGR